MSDPLSFYQQGQRLRAATVNELVADARARRGVGKGGPPELDGQNNNSTVVLMRNHTDSSDGGDTVKQFGVLGIDGVTIPYKDGSGHELPEFKVRAMLDGVAPTLADHVGKFAIALEPIDPGKIGPAVIVGAVQCQIDVVNETDGFADVKDGDITQLRSGMVGFAEILWKETGTGTKWALVMLGGPQVPPTIKITGHAQEGANQRFKYAWSEMEKGSAGGGAWTVKTGGRSGTTTSNFALCEDESANYGSGPVADQTIATVTRVFSFGSNTEYWFSARACSQTFLVQLTQDGGSAGNNTTLCSYTYTLKDVTGTIILGTSIALTGTGNRIVKAAMTAATWGLACYDGDGTLMLAQAFESFQQKNCT